MLENTEGAIKSGKSRETGNIGNTRRRKNLNKATTCVGHHYYYTLRVMRNCVCFINGINNHEKHNTMCVGHQYAQTKHK